MMEDATCSPYSQTYTAPTLLTAYALGTVSIDIETECTNDNTGACAINTCIVESTFIYETTRLSISGSSLEVTNYHHLGFQVDTTCTPIQSTVNSPRDACCGSYPERFPFRTLGGLQECCSDGKVRATGGC